MTPTEDADVLALAEELRALAEKATPGPWEAKHTTYVSSIRNPKAAGFIQAQIWSRREDYPTAEAAKANADFIAFCRNNAERIARALSRPVAEGWRPIDSAPKDGRAVLLWLDDEDFAVKAMWGLGPDNDGAMWWIPEMDFYQTDDGMHRITHWMPLPAAPARED